MPGWGDSLTLPDGSATPVNQAYERISVNETESIWINTTAKAAGNAETLRLRRKTLMKTVGALKVPYEQINFNWVSKDSTDVAESVFNCTLQIPTAVQTSVTGARKKVKGFMTGILNTMSDTDAERDVLAACRHY